MKHTPGPWKVIQDDADSYAIEKPDNKPGTVYICREICQGADNGKSDAKLIAAAPEMHEALSFCLSVIKSNGIFDVSEKMAVKKAEAALKKAIK